MSRESTGLTYLTRPRTDALAVRVGVALEANPDATLVSLDGRSVYDTKSKARFLMVFDRSERIGARSSKHQQATTAACDRRTH